VRAPDCEQHGPGEGRRQSFHDFFDAACGRRLGGWRKERLHSLSNRRMLLSVTKGKLLSKPTDLIQGTVDLLILKVIALEPMHGWAIAQRIRQMSGDVLQLSQGALYPCLHKLEQNGWIRAEWAVSENNRRAKYYSLTRAGRKVLDREAAQWERLSAAISLVVRASDAPG